MFQAYDTKRPSRGHMLIFNNSEFSPSSGYSSRIGSEKDTENLTSTFQNFGFVVTKCENKTMKQCLEKFHQEAVSDPLCSSVVIVLASHGRRDKRGIIASDGGVFDLDWVICRFCRDCAKALAGKPKMIILQCCRGSQCPIIEYLCITSWSVYTKTHPMSPDVLMLSGNVSWRDRESGSWFIQAICEIFREYSPKEHVMDMLIKV
uniref:Caspase family p20 domain-containing protein n=1 Tax=Capitella teleta TaxID=283909 RepID=X1YZF6_CAPTE